MISKVWCTRKLILLLLIAVSLVVIRCDSRPLAGGGGGYGGDVELGSGLFEGLERDEFVRMAGYGEDKLSTVLITGVVLCNRICLPESNGHYQLGSSQSRHMMPVSGALVRVTCHDGHINSKYRQAEAESDEYGEFVIDLPSHLHALPSMEKACSVKVVQMPENSPCHRSASATGPKGIRLSSVGNGVRTYTTGKMTLSHISAKNSEACMKRQEEDVQTMSW